MELFTNLAEMLKQGVTATIAITVTTNGKMTVCTNFTMRDGSLDGELQPFVLKGTPEELDEGFLEAIQEPMETVEGLVNNLKEFKEAAQKVKAETEKKLSNNKNSADIAKKAEEEKKKLEEEKKAAEMKEKMAAQAIEDADLKMEEGAFNTAKALYGFAAETLSDKKAKADVQKKISAAETECGGMLCGDSPEDAEKALEAFKRSFEPASDDPVEETN